jgi:hypothetical protein
LNSLSNYNPLLESGQARRLAVARRWLAPATRAWRLPVGLVALCYLVLPSLLSLLFMRWLNAMPHGFVNLEVLVIGAVGVFLPRSAVFLLLLADLLADCAYSICYTYQFSVSDLIESLHFLGDLPWSRLAAGCGVAAVAVLLCGALALVRPRAGRRVYTACALTGLAAVLLPIDVLSGQNPLWHQDVSLLSDRVTRSPVLTLAVRALAANRTEWRARRAGNAHMDSASAQLTPWLGTPASGAARPNVVLIVVESWGLLLDPHLAQALTAPYAETAIARSYRVTYGAAPFTGLTVPGEARELCHSTMGFGILHPSAQMTEQCLPGLLHALGYRNIALHGYAGEMFYRDSWYRELGFDRTWFAPELRQAGLPRCEGAFPGICDGAIARFIGDSLGDSSGDSQPDARDARPKFIYWVTLNSHLPVPARPELPADNACAAQPALHGSAALCSWFRLVRAVHASVSQVAAQTAARPTIFILVGDHAPPFANSRLRSQFSSSQVPYMMLTPESLAQP